MNVDLVRLSWDIRINFAFVPLMSISCHCESFLVCVLCVFLAFKSLGWNGVVKRGEHGLLEFDAYAFIEARRTHFSWVWFKLVGNRSVCCSVCAVSRATWLLFTGVPAPCVALRVRCPGPLGSCSLVCLRGLLCCVCGVLGHLAPVHWCARSVRCFLCALSWATWLLFTGVPARCVALRVWCLGPLGSCSPVCPRGVLCCRTPHTQHNKPRGHTGEQEPSGPGHRTRKATHRSGTPVKRSQVAQDTAQANQHTERAHR